MNGISFVVIHPLWLVGPPWAFPKSEIPRVRSGKDFCDLGLWSGRDLLFLEKVAFGVADIKESAEALRGPSGMTRSLPRRFEQKSSICPNRPAKNPMVSRWFESDIVSVHYSPGCWIFQVSRTARKPPSLSNPIPCHRPASWIWRSLILSPLL